MRMHGSCGEAELQPKTEWQTRGCCARLPGRGLSAPKRGRAELWSISNRPESNRPEQNRAKSSRIEQDRAGSSRVDLPNKRRRNGRAGGALGDPTPRGRHKVTTFQFSRCENSHRSTISLPCGPLARSAKATMKCPPSLWQRCGTRTSAKCPPNGSGAAPACPYYEPMSHCSPHFAAEAFTVSCGIRINQVRRNAGQGRAPTQRI